MADATSTTGPVVRGWNANGGAAEPSLRSSHSEWCWTSTSTRRS